MKKMYIDIIGNGSFNVLYDGEIFLCRYNGYRCKWFVFDYDDFIQEEIVIADNCMSRIECLRKIVSYIFKLSYGT